MNLVKREELLLRAVFALPKPSRMWFLRGCSIVVSRPAVAVEGADATLRMSFLCTLKVSMHRPAAAVEGAAAVWTSGDGQDAPRQGGYTHDSFFYVHLRPVYGQDAPRQGGYTHDSFVYVHLRSEYGQDAPRQGALDG